jgi:hypothetical protein
MLGLMVWLTKAKRTKLHLSRASIVKYVPGEVRPPPPKFRARNEGGPLRVLYVGRATETERPYVV